MVGSKKTELTAADEQHPSTHGDNALQPPCRDRHLRGIAAMTESWAGGAVRDIGTTIRSTVEVAEVRKRPE